MTIISQFLSRLPYNNVTQLKLSPLYHKNTLSMERTIHIRTWPAVGTSIIITIRALNLISLMACHFQCRLTRQNE